MVSQEGAFYSALDADSEGEEGKYYIWTREELEGLLGGDLGLFSEYYNINETGLWEHDRYILYRTADQEVFAKKHGLDQQAFQCKIQDWNEILLKARGERIAPGLDDKSLTSWSSLMISGLVQAYLALGEAEYLDLASASASLISEKLWSEEKVLYRNYKNGHRSIGAFHIDYALYIEACLDLYEASMERKWLDLASELTRATMDRFYAEETGMFNYNAADAEILISNNVETRDNVIPSSNAVMAHNLFRIGHILYNREYLELSGSMLDQMTGRFEQYPHGFARWGRLLLKQLNPFYEVAVVGPSASSVLERLSKEYLPHVILVGSAVEDNLPLFMDRYARDKTRIFVCQDNVCQLPVEDPDDAKTIYHIR
ncbi:MAG: thioredoxin domain-containing protein, partial [Bacteroidales bacterium]|nr:thioredoxin domain-containing protein [Bacteroidales bacterium]